MCDVTVVDAVEAGSDTLPSKKSLSSKEPFAFSLYLILQRLQRMIRSLRRLSVACAETHRCATTTLLPTSKRVPYFGVSQAPTINKPTSSSLNRSYSTFLPFSFSFPFSPNPPSAPPRMSTDATQDKPTSVEVTEMPSLEVRWMHTGAKHLALPTAPITAAETAYKAFSMDESDRIEKAWEVLSAEEKKKIVNEWGLGDGEWSQQMIAARSREKGEDSPEDEEFSDPPTPGGSVASEPETPQDKAEIYKSVIERARNDPSKLDAIHGVPVSQVSSAPKQLLMTRTRSLRSIWRRYLCILSSGRSLVPACPSFVAHGLEATRHAHVPGSSPPSSRGPTPKSSRGSHLIRRIWLLRVPQVELRRKSLSTSCPRSLAEALRLCLKMPPDAVSQRKLFLFAA